MNTENKGLKWSMASVWAELELKKAITLRLFPMILNEKDLTKPMSRAEFAAVAVMLYEEMSGCTARSEGSNPFTDTSDENVLKAYNLGIVNGTSATTFHPANLISREEAAVMLTRLVKCVHLDGWFLAKDSDYALVFTMPTLFLDDAKISSWAKSSVYFMVAESVINGLDNGEFAPKNTVAREQLLTIAVRMMKAFKGKPPKYDVCDVLHDMEMLAQMIAVFPRSDAVDIIWHTLGGYWTAEGNLFVGFVSQGGCLGIERGVWDTGYGGFGTFRSGKQTGKYSLEMVLNFPEKPADEMTGYIPEKNVTMHLDTSNLGNNGTVDIKIEDLGNGGWHSYAHSHPGRAMLCACFPNGMDECQIERRLHYFKGPLTVETLAEGLSSWTGLDFSVSVAKSDLSVAVDWAARSALLAGGKPNGDFNLSGAETREWFMLDSLWRTITENFGELDVYYTMNGGKELKVPTIGYPSVFPLDIPYLGCQFYCAHRDLRDDDNVRQRKMHTQKRTKLINPAHTVDMSGMNLYCQNDHICLANDSNAKVSLYVNAEKDNNGEFMFDDGQDWLLLVETSFGDYQLFPRKYVQLGMVSYVAFYGCSGASYDVFHVLVTVSQSAGYEIFDCVFDNGKKAFKVVPVYNASNINPVGGSRPQ